MPDYVRLFQISVIVVLVTVVAMFPLNRLDGVARAIPVLQVILMSVALFGTRVVYRMYRAHRTGRRQFRMMAPLSGANSVLLVGFNPVTELYVNCARTYASKRVELCGIVTERPRLTVGEVAYGLPILGDVSKLAELLSTLQIHGVFVRRIVVTGRRGAANACLPPRHSTA